MTHRSAPLLLPRLEEHASVLIRAATVGQCRMQRCGIETPRSVGDLLQELAGLRGCLELGQKALGSMSREELGQFFQTYQGMSEQEKAQLREHSGELQQLGPAERNWALQNPDAVRQLGAMPEDERKKVVETYQKLTPEEQQKLR